MAQTSHEQIRYIDEAAVKLWRERSGARPRCEIEGDRCLLQAKLYRCFPLTNPGDYISLADASGAEVGILRDPSRLDEESKQTLFEELDRLYFTPIIERIVSLKQEASMWRWEVQTQRGAATFYLRGVRDSVHEVAPGRWQIYSVDGQRYEIQDYDSLDARTQALFESLF